MSKAKIVLSHLAIALLVAGALAAFYSVQMLKAEVGAKQKQIAGLESQVNDLKDLSAPVK